MRVSIQEEGPTVFVTLDNATEAPPCCVHNETDLQIFFQTTLIRKVRLPLSLALTRTLSRTLTPTPAPTPTPTPTPALAPTLALTRRGLRPQQPRLSMAHEACRAPLQRAAPLQQP